MTRTCQRRSPLTLFTSDRSKEGERFFRRHPEAPLIVPGDTVVSQVCPVDVDYFVFSQVAGLKPVICAAKKHRIANQEPEQAQQPKKRARIKDGFVDTTCETCGHGKQWHLSTRNGECCYCPDHRKCMRFVSKV